VLGVLGDLGALRRDDGERATKGAGGQCDFYGANPTTRRASDRRHALPMVTPARRGSQGAARPPGPTVLDSRSGALREMTCGKMPQPRAGESVADGGAAGREEFRRRDAT
jgi:hypothetical protein